MKFKSNFSPLTMSLAGVALVGVVLALLAWSAPVSTPILLGWYMTALSLPGYFWLQKRGVKPGIALLLLILTLLIGGIAIGVLTIVSVNSLQEGLHLYLGNLDEFASGLQAAAGETGAALKLADRMGSAGLGKLLAAFLPAIIDAASNFLFGLVLVAFLLLEAPRFQRLLKMIWPSARCSARCRL